MYICTRIHGKKKRKIRYLRTYICTYHQKQEQKQAQYRWEKKRTSAYICTYHQEKQASIKHSTSMLSIITEEKYYITY